MAPHRCAPLGRDAVNSTTNPDYPAAADGLILTHSYRLLRGAATQQEFPIHRPQNRSSVVHRTWRCYGESSEVDRRRGFGRVPADNDTIVAGTRFGVVSLAPWVRDFVFWGADAGASCADSYVWRTTK